MLRAGAFVRRPLGWSAFGLVTLLAVAAVTTSADARGRRHRHHAAAAESYEPPFASMVVDANSGAVLQATNADSPRHPASLTKIMTLYLLFERLQADKIKMSTDMEVSAHAAAQAPSKLGLKPGQTIDVETAIRAIVTKSANDVAVVVAEALGGSEENFARMMTITLRNVSRTLIATTTGGPNYEQITMARDMTILGPPSRIASRNITTTLGPARSATTARNSGITITSRPRCRRRRHKTGYIHDFGFNIVVSMCRGARHLMAVVFGGRSASARDACVVGLLDDTIQLASVKRTAPPVSEGAEITEARTKAAMEKSRPSRRRRAGPSRRPARPSRSIPSR